MVINKNNFWYLIYKSGANLLQNKKNQKINLLANL